VDMREPSASEVRRGRERNERESSGSECARASTGVLDVLGLFPVSCHVF